MNTIKKVQGLHLAFLMIQIGIIAVFLYVQKTFDFHWGSEDGFWMYVAPISSIALILVGNFIFNTRMKTAISKDASIQENIYATSSLLRMMTSEFALIIVMLIYFVTGNVLYVGYAIFLLLFFFALRPSEQKLHAIFSNGTTTI